MIRKFYDTDISGFSYGSPSPVPHVVNEEEVEDQIYIECECSAHLLKVISNTIIYTKSNDTKQVQQSYYLAMFDYVNSSRSLSNRFKIAWRIFWTGKVYDDQMTLHPDEAKKLADFITKNLKS